MAGAGYKLFNTGDVLTAAQVNTYLNEQTVMVFADSAARTTALSGVLAEGMMSYLQDTDSVEVYDGSAWTAVGGGGSSPLTTKGDLYGFSTVDARVPIGTNGHVLTADSTESLGLKWAAPAGGGKVLQVVQDDDTSGFSTASTTYQDTGLSVTITPSSASSKVLITVAGAQGYAIHSGSQTIVTANFRLVRTATQLQEIIGGNYNMAASSGMLFYFSPSFGYLDSPATTSATTYKVQAKCETSQSTTVAYTASATQIASIIAYEIGA
jgi:hypothetical protein